MTRVSLTEDYDDRSVISKLNEMDKRVKENASVVTSAEASARQSAQSAQETADRFAGSVGAVVQNANAQINASKAQVDKAKAEVDETVTTVAQAVTTANQASASAQQSAQTVAGYGDRLTAVEDKAQGNSADIDHLEIETADLYDRDANDIKAHYDHEQTMTGSLVVEKGIRAYQYGWHAAFKSGMAQGHYAVFAKIVGGNIGQYHYIELVENSNNASAHGLLVIHDVVSLDGCCFSWMTSHGGNNPLTTGSIVVASDGRDIFLLWKKQAPYGSLGARSYLITNYGAVMELDHNITWYDAGVQEYENLNAFQTVVTPVMSIPNVPAGAPSDAAVNIAYVSATGANRLNNLVHNVDDESIKGWKTFTHISSISMHGALAGYMPARSGGGFAKLVTLNLPSNAYGMWLEVHMGGGVKRFTYKRLFVSKYSDAVVIRCTESWGYDQPESKAYAKQETDGTISLYFPVEGWGNTNVYCDAIQFGSGYREVGDFTGYFTRVAEADITYLTALPEGCVEMVKVTNYM